MTTSSLLLNLFVEGCVQGSVYALLAIGFSLLWWVSGVVHLAHGGVTLAGGLLLYLLFDAWGVPFVLAVPLTIVGVVSIGLAVTETVYAPLIRHGTDEMGLLTASLGVLIVMEYVLTIGFGPEGVTLEADVLRHSVIPGKLPVFDSFAAVLLVGTAVAFMLLHFAMTRTAVGRRLRAVAANPQLARSIGIQTSLVGRQVAAIAAFLALPAAAALLFSTGLAPSEALHLVLVSAVTAIVGGRGSLLGAWLAGIVMGIAESVTAWQFSTGWRQLVTFALLYAILLARPQGLFGKSA